MDDDEFDDSGFDDLNAELFDQLETAALTQRAPQRQVANVQTRSRPASDYGAEYDDDDGEEQVIDLNAQDANDPFKVDHAANAKRTQGYRGTSQAHFDRNSQVTGSQATGAESSGHLRARLVKLEQERTLLEKSAADARSAVLSKAGEIAIVRSNHDRTVKEYEKRMADMQQQHAEETFKYKQALEAARKEREKVETSNKFLEHDLAQELERAKQAKKGERSAQPKRLVAPDQTSTPKKSARSLPFRDGFEDDEIMVVSPSKSKDKRSGLTPRVGSKRKRPLEISPAKPLDLSPSHSQGMLAPEMASFEPAKVPTESYVPPSSDTRKLGFMRSIISHRTAPSQQRTVDGLAQHVLLLHHERSATISSLVYDALKAPSPELDYNDFLKSFCEGLASIWSTLLEQTFYGPLFELTELVQYTLLASPPALSAGLIPLLVPLCCRTIDLVAFPTANKSRDSTATPTSLKDLASKIRLSQFFDLLSYLAGCCLFEEAPLTAFWSAASFDFVLVMLHRTQPLSHIIFMLELLRTSVLESTFGPIDNSNLLQQPRRESSLIDRLTVLLFETPDPQPNPDQGTDPPKQLSPWIKPPPAPPPIPYTAKERLDLRSAVLALLRQLCNADHGGNALASHRLAFGRLIRFLHESVLAMYAYREETHAQSTRHVNMSVTVLAHLSFSHADVLDLRARLAVIPQGTQKHLVALSRVAFAEGETPLESGIEAEVAEAAHRMLDECLSPEEGEAVMNVFSSAISSADSANIDIRDNSEAGGDTDFATTDESRAEKGMDILMTDAG